MKKYKQGILYLIFGALTTFINVLCYYFSYNLFKMPNVLSTVLSWMISVLFAFVTNRIFVFESKDKGIKNIMREISAFFVCRLLTGVIDVAIMWISVDIMGWNSLLWKIISNLLVIVLNFFASKMLIFKKK
jgi:putative flippase GtrA